VLLVDVDVVVVVVLVVGSATRLVRSCNARVGVSVCTDLRRGNGVHACIVIHPYRALPSAEGLRYPGFGRARRRRRSYGTIESIICQRKDTALKARSPINTMFPAVLRTERVVVG
jgi:hypothetical protein